eukprot:CAMPEP_0197660678 /NCGR_PEP_ID=MMETSP1338-20131121/50996_1 /TAXON_ID=43686 ORGANISM="Pelagodinium beii, Strain RCC1491" /NCGR_SAMPLE_ID=MMETSP1338 /ASSEMBLY_ACC=CAM_ASM_000754 /LENGTH=359 /DNA_ID=CAMNT_0043238087 /DNA_START=89 /DNA_END=1168 /DNA_ORIENTATION=+
MKPGLLEKGLPLPAGEKVGYAIVGLGRAGNFHLTSLKFLSDSAKLLWVIDSDEAKIVATSQREGCKGSTDVGDALNDPGVHAVVIASVTYSHYDYCKRALKAGKAVFTEKPISHDRAELQEILEMAISVQKPFVVGYQRRVDKNFRALRKEIVSGAVGDLRLIKCCSRDNPLPPLEYLKVSGGIFFDMLCHDFDMIHFLSSGQVPEEVYSVGHCYNQDIAKMDDIDMVAVTMKFKSGLIATVDCSRIAAYGYDQRVEAFGEKGMACANNESTSTVVVATSSGYQHPMSEWSFPERYKHTYTTELAEFTAMVKTNSVEDEAIVRRHLDLDTITAAAELSYRLKRPVKLEEVPTLRPKLPH